MRRIITLTTDFGTKDNFIGVMKGVIVSINPEARIIDISHEVPPQDVFRAAFMLGSAYRYFPPGTVHVAVVDPGVGSSRAAVVVEAGGQVFIGPDNGVFTYVYGEEREVVVREIAHSGLTLPKVSSTFHGRDVFAPAAARISMGFDVEEAGPVVQSPVRLEIPKPEVRERAVIGSVIYIDFFGNLITNVGSELLARASTVRVSGLEIEGISSSYTETAQGGFVAVIGSSGFLEISLNGGSAARVLNIDETLERTVEVRVELARD